jgi:hypothetical protein
MSKVPSNNEFFAKGGHMASKNISKSAPACQHASDAEPTWKLSNASNAWRTDPRVQTQRFYNFPSSPNDQLGTKNIGTLYGYDTFPYSPVFSDTKISKEYYKNYDEVHLHDSKAPYYLNSNPCAYPVKPAWANYTSYR